MSDKVWVDAETKDEAALSFVLFSAGQARARLRAIAGFNSECGVPNCPCSYPGYVMNDDTGQRAFFLAKYKLPEPIKDSAWLASDAWDRTLHTDEVPF